MYFLYSFGWIIHINLYNLPLSTIMIFHPWVCGGRLQAGLWRPCPALGMRQLCLLGKPSWWQLWAMLHLLSGFTLCGAPFTHVLPFTFPVSFSFEKLRDDEAFLLSSLVSVFRSHGKKVHISWSCFISLRSPCFLLSLNHSSTSCWLSWSWLFSIFSFHCDTLVWE